MIDKVSKSECVLCGACVQACPKSCILLQDEYYSFKYPKIDQLKCVGCNLCEKVCPATKDKDVDSLKICYAVKSRQPQVLKRSSSGGVFFSIASQILRKGGVVVGAAFDNNFKVKHKVVETEESLLDLCGSKYVQSDLGNVFEEVKNILTHKRLVLFVGSSCQTASLVSFLGEKPQNLILIDFICHGVVSATVFEEYKRYLERKYKGKIIKFEFRNKEKGWLNSGLKVEFDNNKIYTAPLYRDTYMQGYFKNLNLRESCYNCGYKNFMSKSDITMGDFWGVQELYPLFYDEMGNSVIVINTQVGMEIFNSLQGVIDVLPIKMDDIIKYNSGLILSFQVSNEREKYFKKAKAKGYIKPLEKYIKKPIYIRILRRLKILK